MTTETTSPTLHERLRQDAQGGWSLNPIHEGTENYHGLHPDDLAAIQADLIAEATAPLQAKIEHVRAVHTALRHTSTMEIAALRAENAALRRAADALRDAALCFKDEVDRIGTETQSAFHLDRRGKGLADAVDSYNAATTPRAEETPMSTKLTPGTNHPQTLVDRLCEIRDEHRTGGTKTSRTVNNVTHFDGDVIAMLDEVRRFDAEFPSPLAPLVERVDRLAGDMIDTLSRLNFLETASSPADAAPSPTDAAAEGDPFTGPTPPPTWQERMDEWSANTSLELTAIAERQAAIERKIDLTDPNNIINGENTSGFDTRRLAVEAGYSADKANERLAAIEQRADDSDQDPALQARPHKERIDDLVTRADGANDRLDMHMQRMDELWRRIEGLQREVTAIDRRVLYSAQNTGRSLQEHDDRLAALEKAVGNA